MALEPVVADGGFVAGLNGAGAALLAAADHFKWTFQGTEVAPFALQLVQALSAAGAASFLVGVNSNTTSSCTDTILGTADSQENAPLTPKNTIALTNSASPSFSEDFTRLGRLGRGAFGEVWHCRDHADGKEYAVKAVRFKSGRKDAESRAMREVEMLAAVNHLNIMRYHHHWIEFDQDPIENEVEVSASSLSYMDPLNSQMPAPMASPVLKPVLPTLVELSTDLSCSYNGGSCEYTGVIFEETHADEPNVEVETSPIVGVGEHRMEATDGVRCVSSGKAPSHDIGHTASESNPSDEFATLYIQVELCRKETLQDWISSRNAKAMNRDDEMIAREAINLFNQCTCALAHLHDRSFVHRDVKPSNIFFSQDGSVRLGDFGLAKAVDKDAQSPIAANGPSSETRHESDMAAKGQRGKKHACAVGTPSYASPEQRCGEHVDVSTDVFSLGLVLLELICPVKTQMERATMLQRLRDGREVPSAKYLRPKCRKLARLALWMTEPEPSKRPTAKEIISFTRRVRHRHSTCGNVVGAPIAVGKSSKAVGSIAVAARTVTANSNGNRLNGVSTSTNSKDRWLHQRCLHRSSHQNRVIQGKEVRTSDSQKW